MIWRNKKKGTLYKVVGKCINCTNAQDGQLMIMYESLGDDNLTFVREEKEFIEKFEKFE